MAHDKLHCVVVTPETTLFDEAVDFVALPLFDGELGVLPGRAPLIGRLGYGELRAVVGAATKRYYIDGGFAQVANDVVTVLTSNALPADKVDRIAAAETLSKAQALHPSNDAAFLERDRMLERSRAQIRIAENQG
jgi:F-type H+-transporting ATPase subunit epsilon